MAAPRTRLIVRGADAGSCVSANRAIVEGYEAGVLLNTSIMVPAPAFDDAVDRFRKCPNLCLGLHATLTSEWDTPKWGPVMPRGWVPTLVDRNGNFFWHHEFLNESKPNPDQMIAEIRAQLVRARNRGLKINYIDEHMHLLWLPGLRERFDKLAADEGLIQAESVRYLPVEWEKFSAPLDALSDGLKRAEPGTYAFFTHPGMDTPEMRKMVHPGIEPGTVARSRNADREMLISPDLKKLLKEVKAEPIRYDQA